MSRVRTFDIARTILVDRVKISVELNNLSQKCSHAQGRNADHYHPDPGRDDLAIWSQQVKRLIASDCVGTITDGGIALAVVVSPFISLTLGTGDFVSVDDECDRLISPSIYKF